LNKADAGEALKSICDQSGYNLAINTGIKGTITVHVDSLVALDALAIVAELAGAAFVIEGQTIKVFTQSQYVELYGVQPFEKRRLEVFELAFTSPDKLVPELNKLKSSKGLILTDANTNRLYVLETPPVLKLMRQVVTSFDSERQFRSYDLQHVSPAEMVVTLNEFLTPSATVIPDPSRNRLIVMDQENKLNWLDSIIAEFDKPSKLVTRTLQLQHVGVTDVIPHVEGLLTPNAGGMISDGVSNQIIITDLP